MQAQCNTELIWDFKIVSVIQMDSMCESQQCEHFDYENNETCVDNV